MDLEYLLAPISDESPSGVGLEYDDLFRQLEKAAKGKPGSVVDESRPGASIAATPPDWPEVIDLCGQLLPKSKDIRVIAYLAKAQLATKGLTASATVLGMLHQVLDQFWDTVYPLLDAEDANDPTMRLNALACLSDPDDYLKLLRESVLFRHPSIGPIKFRVLETALGVLPESQNENEMSLSLNDSESAVTDILESQTEEIQALSQLKETVLNIQKLVDERATGASNLDLKPLLTRLKPVGDMVERMKLLASGDQASEDSDRQGTAADGGGSKGGVMTRREAKRQIEKICLFFESSEPSNPAPLFLRRAVAIMDMSFLDIVRDLAPESVATFEHYSGNRNNESNE